MSDIEIIDVTAGSDGQLRELDGRLLLVFRELLRLQSATAAAERLNVSQSTISHALGRLRRLHRDQLFVRRPHGLAPTRRARELAPLVDAVLDAAGRLLGDPETFDPSSSQRTFHVAASEFATALFGGPLLRRWRSSAPRVSLLTRQLGVDDGIDALRRGDLDLAIGRFAGRPPAGCERADLFEDHYCVVARLGHPRVEGRIDLTTYLAASHVIAGSPGEGGPGERVPRQLTIAAVVPAWLTALVMVAASDAIATCPRRLADQHAAALGLQIAELPNRMAPIKVSALHRNPSDDGVAWLVSELREIAT